MKKKKVIFLIISLIIIMNISKRVVKYDIDYEKNISYKIPEVAERFDTKETRGSAYLLKNGKETIVYLDYAVGNNISKPNIVSISTKGKTITVKVKKPINKSLMNINPHYFKIKVKGKYDKVILKEI